MQDSYRKENETEENNRISRYTVIDKLGKGGSGKVLLVRDTNTKQYYAMKIIHDIEVAEKEAEILRMVDYAGIPKLHDYFTLKRNAYLVMEYVKGRTLEELNRDEGEKNVRIRIAVKIAEILSYLHTLPTPVIHGDLKPENIIISEQGEVKLIDFGSAHLLTKTPEKIHSTIGCAAPEMMNGKSGLQGDVYAFGMIFARIMTGKDLDFTGKDKAFLMRMGLNYSEASIVERCLNAKERKRYPSGKEVLGELLKCDRKERFRESLERVMCFICTDIGGILALYGLLSYFIMGYYKGKYFLSSGCLLLLIHLIGTSADRVAGVKEFKVTSSVFLADR